MTQTRIIEADDAGVSNTDICAFYAAHWARPIALSLMDFLHWQMKAAPGAMGRSRSG